MGRRGPAKKPTALRMLHGDEKRFINDNEPQPREGVPEVPPDLSPGARAVWDYVVPELDAMDLAKRPDRDQLAAYCEAVYAHRRAAALIGATDVVIEDRDHQPRTHPAFRVMTQAGRTMLIFAREFGLTPASRVQFKAEQVAYEHAERLLS
jgi:P27 family predicted phage terminase small subunit